MRSFIPYTKFARAGLSIWSISQVSGKNQFSNSRSEISPAKYSASFSWMLKSREYNMSKPPIERVSATELRKMFNDGKYLEQVKQGALRPVLVANNHPSPPRANEPTCTRSQYIIYVNRNGKKVAGVHRYLRPDGKIGASGLPDPKELLINGILYMPNK